MSCLPPLGGGSSQAARAGFASLWALHVLAGFWLVGYTGAISLPVPLVLALWLALEIFFQAMGLSKLQALQNPSFRDQIFAQVLRKKALKL